MALNENYRITLGHAVSDENGKATKGKAGNQSGKELKFQAWYNRSKGWTHVLRCKDLAQRYLIADAMEAAVRNRHIGYDQNQRGTLYDAAKGFGFDPALVKTDVETDCSALVAVCCNYAGIDVSRDIYTGNELAALTRTKLFKIYSSNAYIKDYKKLYRGDILLGPGHTAVVVNAKYAMNRPLSYTKGAVLQGNDVKALQTRLNAILGDGTVDVDGKFGPKTSNAVTDAQAYLRKKKKLNACTFGLVDKVTAEAMGFIYIG